MSIKLNEDFEYTLEEFGKPVTYARPTEEELDSWRDRIPQPLFDFCSVFGWTEFNKGKLWLPDPRDFAAFMEVLFESDSDIDHKKCHLVAYSCFGKLFIWSEQFQVIRVSLPQGWIFSSALTDNKLENNADKLAAFPFFGDVKTGYDSVDENGKPLFKRAVKKYGALEPGECFGYVPALAMGGSGNLDEIQRVKALEHFIFVPQLQPLTLMKWEGTSMLPVRQIGV